MVAQDSKLIFFSILVKKTPAIMGLSSLRTASLSTMDANTTLACKSLGEIFLASGIDSNFLKNL